MLSQSKLAQVTQSIDLYSEQQKVVQSIFEINSAIVSYHGFEIEKRFKTKHLKVLPTFERAFFYDTVPINYRNETIL